MRSLFHYLTAFAEYASDACKTDRQKQMYKTYHLCFTSHQEVMYRNAEDMNRSFNALCSALHKTGSRCLAENDLPNHHHGCYETECPAELVQIKRQAYGHYFNEKYDRKGTLGDPGYFLLELQGIRHLLAALSYSIKNTVHHGITATPFEWPYCSANAYFRKELGKLFVPDVLLTPAQIERALPRRASFDSRWRMGVDGVFLRESVIETALVENLYATPQAFNYLVTRKSGEDWYKEQEADGNGLPPITLESMETQILQFVPDRRQAVSEMLRNEQSRYAKARMNDLQVCELIDSRYVPKYQAFSVYHLTDSQKNAIANDLYRQYRLGASQIRRCLVF